MDDHLTSETASIMNSSDLPHAVAGFFFCPETGRVLLHQRDGETTINPHKWAFFTGLMENGESPMAAFIREVNEEIGYALVPDRVQTLDKYLNEERQTIRHVFLAQVETEFTPKQVFEGAGVGWFKLHQTSALDLTQLTRRDLDAFMRSRNQ